MLAQLNPCDRFIYLTDRDISGAITPDAGNNNYEGIGDTSIYNPIESFDIENPSIP
jgi:hypothetical protein